MVQDRSARGDTTSAFGFRVERIRGRVYIMHNCCWQIRRPSIRWPFSVLNHQRTHKHALQVVHDLGAAYEVEA